MKRKMVSLDKIIKKQKEIGIQIKEKVWGYVLASLGFVTAFAWNDAMKSFIEYCFPLEKNNLIFKFLYALLITVFLVIIGFVLTKKTEEEKIESLTQK